MKFFAWIFLIGCIFSSRAQELFPNNEPASTLPKNVLGLRTFATSYNEYGTLRNLFVLRAMYGITPKLTVMISGSESNHHGDLFPPNLVYHTHNGAQTAYGTGNFQRGVQYPYQFNGLYFFGKYRFLSIDGQNRHFRMALYGEYSTVHVAHDEAEPSLLDDTKGYGGGLIATWLRNHLAVSLTTGAIIPGSYSGYSPDTYGGPNVPTKIIYGNAVKYNLSFGYLLYPFVYTNYRQTNVNLYLEFMGKSYGGATVYQYGDKNVPVSTPLLQAGNYVEAHPGLQIIFRSNLRVDFSAGFPVINQSYARFYPIYMLGIQRYFYSGKRVKGTKTS
jgi:hypothetical protein